MQKLLISGCLIATLGLAGRSSAQGPPCVPCPHPQPDVQIDVIRRIPVRVPTCECETKRFLTAEIREREEWDNIEVVREVPKQVTVCKQVPCTVTDPCTGCSKTVYKEETVCQTVMTKVYEVIPVKRKYYVLTNYGSVERVVPRTEIVWVSQPEKVTTKACYAGAAVNAPAPGQAPELIAPPKEKEKDGEEKKITDEKPEEKGTPEKKITDEKQEGAEE